MKEALLFLEKKEQKNFSAACHRHGPETAKPAEGQNWKKFFWFFLFTKRTPSLSLKPQSPADAAP